MRTIRTKVYQFNELDEQAKGNAINWFLSSFNDSFAFEDIKEDAKQIGLKIISLDDHRNNEGQFMLAANEVAQNIFNNHGEHCETYKTAEYFMKEWQPLFDEYMKTEEGDGKLIEVEDEFLQSLLEDYRIMYNKQWEYEQSSEFAKETIEANEYEFTKEGNRFHQ